MLFKSDWLQEMDGVISASQSSSLSAEKAKFVAMSRVVYGIRNYDQGLSREGDFRLFGAQQVASAKRYRRRPLNSDAAKLLRVAWQSELAARVGDRLDEPGLRLATLQTLPVQAYYSVFNSARALTMVSGSPVHAHATIHNLYAAQYCQNAAGAWGVRLHGDSEDIGTCVITPKICVPVKFNPMETRRDDSEYVWAALRMTRKWKILKARDDWLKAKKKADGTPYKILPAQARASLVADLRQSTLLDFVYELRCSTNYRSVDEYSIEVDDTFVSMFHRGLLHVMDSGLLFFEGQIARYVGSAAIEKEFKGWVSRVNSIGSWATESGTSRIAAYKDVGL